jgi:hypothetical protein
MWSKVAGGEFAVSNRVAGLHRSWQKYESALYEHADLDCANEASRVSSFRDDPEPAVSGCLLIAVRGTE